MEKQRLTPVAGLLLSVACLHAEADGLEREVDVAQLGQLRPVSIQAILDRRVASVSNLRWFDSDHLIAQFSGPVAEETVTRVISLKGVVRELFEGGEHASLSPDGRFLIRHTGGNWTIDDVFRGEDLPVAEPTAGQSGLRPHGQPVWSQDSRYTAVIERYPLHGTRKVLEPIIRADVPVIDVGSTAVASDQPQSRITIFDMENPAAPQEIPLQSLALHARWADDGMLYVSKSDLHSGDAPTLVARIQPGSRNIKIVYRTPGRFQSMVPVAQPSGDLLALVLDADNRTWDDFQSLILIDKRTGEELRRVTHNLPLLGRDYVWSRQGTEVYARVRNGGLDQIYAIPLDGKPRRLTNGQRHHFNMELSPDGRYLSYRTEDGYGREDIRVLDLDSGKETVVLILDEPAKEFKLGKWLHVRWTSTDGVKPFGFLFLPPDFDPRREHRMIVDVHGGGNGSRLYLRAPLTTQVAPGPLEWHAWATLGYVVFVPDYRSSGDYGPDVIRARYDSGTFAAVKDADDVLSGTRFVVDQGFVDPSRIAVLGHSAGGQRVFEILTDHDLYAAAILNEPIAPDPLSLFISLASGNRVGQYPAGLYRRIAGGGLADFPERYKTNRMLDSYRITTPTLIMLGNEELGGVMHMPYEVIYSILKHHNVATKLLKFVEEGHTYSRPESAKLAFEEARTWMDAHMGTPVITGSPAP